MTNKNSTQTFKSRLMTSLLCVGSILLYFQSHAQTEIEFKLGGPFLLDKPRTVEQQSGIQLGLTLKREFPIQGRLSIEPGLGFSTSCFFMDGHFVRTNSQTTFQKIPSNYQQNRIQITAINMPLLLRYQIFANSKGEGISIGTGSYLSYLADMRQCYRLNGETYSEKVKNINRLQTYYVVEIGTSGKVNKNKPIAFGAGVKYQLSEHLENSNSFKPLVPYLRVGLRF